MDVRAIPTTGFAAGSGRRTTRKALAIAVTVAAITACGPPQSVVGFLAGTTGARGAVTVQPPQRKLHPALLALGSDDNGERIAAKANLMDFLDDGGLAEEVQRPEGKPTRGRLDEAIVELERLTPTWDPVYSDLIDGKWTVKYSGSFAPGLLSSPTRELALFLYSGGFSAGSALSSFATGFWGQNIGFSVPQKTVTIDGGRDVEASADIDFNGLKSTIKYNAELLPLSGSRMSEEIMTVDLGEPLGKQDAPFELRRSILVTYLDEDVMIVRDESGVPEVLVRVLSSQEPEVPVMIAEDIVGDAVDAVSGNSTDNSTSTA